MMLEIKRISESFETSFDSNNWISWSFSDLVDNIVEKVVPKDSGLSDYIGLEHLDRKSLHIRRFGDTSTLEGDKLKIYKGDIIFAKRNAYLKRVAVCERDAVASAHSLVLRPKAQVVDPNFMAFFMLSDYFWDRAIEISVGSLSPTINWKSLAKQKFRIPPIEEQKRLVEVFNSLDTLLESRVKIVPLIETTIGAIKRDLFDKKHPSYELLGKCGKWLSGGTPSKKNDAFWGGEIPWVSPKDMKKESIDDSIDKITQAAIDANAKVLPKNSILVVVRGMILAHSFPVAMNAIPVSFNQDIKALVASEYFEPEFILSFLQHKKDTVLSLTTTTTHGTKRLATDALFELKVPKLPKAEQLSFLEELRTLKNLQLESEKSVLAIRTMLEATINRIF